MIMSPRKSPSKSAQSSKTKNGTVEHYNAILLEDIKSKMETVIEGMQATEGRLAAQMNDMKTELKGDIEMLKAVVTTHSGEINDLKAGMSGLTAEVSGLKTEVQKLDAKIDQVEIRLSDKIEATRTELKSEMQHANGRWDDHETRITTLERASSS